MPYVQIYLDGDLKNEVEIIDEVTTIGRNPDNDIRIENAGVSGYHARILRSGSSFFVEDVGSRNGTLLNGRKVGDRQPLELGDQITMFRHVLKFSALVSQSQVANKVSQDTHGIAQGGTFAVDVSQLDKLMDGYKDKMPYLRVTDKAGAENKFTLTRKVVLFGKGGHSDFKVKGFFAPAFAAKIAPVEGGFMLIPMKRAKAYVNGVAAKEDTKLRDGDRIDIWNLSVVFHSPSA